MRSFAPSSRCWSSSAVTSPMKYKDGQVQQKQTMMVNVYLMLPKQLVCFLWCGCAYQECQAGCHLSLSDTPLHSGH